MSPIKVTGSVLSLITGALAILEYRVGVIGRAPALREILILEGAFLVVVAVLSFAGPRMSFVLGAILSAAILVALALRWGKLTPDYAYGLAVLALVAVVVDAIASRPAKELSEKDSPLNLPVFG